jgi:hypothetical protein
MLIIVKIKVKHIDEQRAVTYFFREMPVVQHKGIIVISSLSVVMHCINRDVDRILQAKVVRECSVKMKRVGTTVSNYPPLCFWQRAFFYGFTLLLPLKRWRRSRRMRGLFNKYLIIREELHYGKVCVKSLHGRGPGQQPLRASADVALKRKFVRDSDTVERMARLLPHITNKR